MGSLLYVICYFSLAAFNMCSLCLIIFSLIHMCLGVFCLGFILFGILWISWTWVAISFFILWKFSTIISSSIFSCPFFLSSSGTPMILNVGHLTLSQRSPRLSSFLLILFSFLVHLFPPSIFHLIYPIFSLSFSTVGSLQSALISVIALFIIDWLFFIYSRSLLSISCIFSMLVSSLLICNSVFGVSYKI